MLNSKLFYLLALLSLFSACGKEDPATVIKPIQGVIDLPKTGQTVVYETGDNGTYQVGITWPASRFTVNDDTIVDNLTGLMWEKSQSTESFTWADVFTRVSAVNTAELGGYNDWRVPNRKELMSLVHYGIDNPLGWLGLQGFANLQHIKPYWTSTTQTNSADNAWGINMGQGSMGVYAKTITHYVLLVRGTANGPARLPKTGQTTLYLSGDDGALQAGEAWPNPRFINNSDVTMTDTLTGLIWERTPSTTAYACWSEAFERIAFLNSSRLGGHADWRLPNVYELESLSSQTQYTITDYLNANDFAIPPALLNARYWSSTTYGTGNTSAWIFLMNRGGVSFSAKGTKTTVCESGSVNVYVMAVRGGS